MDSRYMVVFGACLVQFTVIGLMIGNGLFFEVFEQEFGWSRTLVSACNALAFFVMGTLAIVGGQLNDRFGPRIVLTVTGIAYGVGYVLLSQVSEPWHLVAVFGVFMALGMSTHDVVTLSTVARWFEKRRGIMTAVVKVGTAIGQVTLPPLVALAIIWFGWKTAVVIIGLGAGAVLLVAAFLIRLPEAPKGGTPVAPRPGLTLAEARGTRIFWTICAVQFLFFPTMMTVPLHIVAHGADLGLSQPAAATLISVFGATSIVGRLTIGTFADRIGGRLSYALCLLPLMAALGALLVVRDTGVLFAVMAVYGFGHGGLFTVVSPTVAEYFGTRAHGSIFGVVLFFGTIGGSVGPILAGWVFDATGAYMIAFATLLGMAATALALALTLPKHGHVAIAKEA